MMTSEDWLNEIQHLSTLDEVFRHAMRQEPKWVPEDVVVQDEYTNDVVFRVRDDAFLVLDSAFGRIVSATIWTHQPTADELLRSRLDRGWTPTASLLKHGPVILGYAACSAQSVI